MHHTCISLILSLISTRHLQYHSICDYSTSQPTDSSKHMYVSVETVTQVLKCYRANVCIVVSNKASPSSFRKLVIVRFKHLAHIKRVAMCFVFSVPQHSIVVVRVALIFHSCNWNVAVTLRYNYIIVAWLGTLIY